MWRGLARVGLLTVLAGSLAGTGLTAARMAANPGLAALREATAAEIVAATDQLLLTYATPQAIEAKVLERLNDAPRNWVALDALVALSEELSRPLGTATKQSLDDARATDFGLLAQVSSCAACAYDAAQCSMSQLMMCQAPVALSPVGDLAGVARAGVAYAGGHQVDTLDLGLSIVGLGATVAVVVTGGSSVVVKAGAGLAKLAHRMGRLSPQLVRMASDSVRAGVNWTALPAVRSLDDLTATLRVDAFAPLTNTLVDLNRFRTATDATAALHILPWIDDAADARKLANAAEALGPKLIGRAEVLGKTRFMRATLRITNLAYGAATSLITLMTSLALLIGHSIQNLLLQRLKSAVRQTG